jgi:hypothetical protein
MSASTHPLPQGPITVIVILSSAPLVGNVPMVIPDGQIPSIVFQIRPEDVERFLQALHDRGLVCSLVFLCLLQDHR